MKWVKLTKYFQGGMKVDYMLVEEERVLTHDSQQELMEEWGENSDGGHAYGYRVDMEILEDQEIPPKEWLEKAVKRTADAIKYLQSKTKRTKLELQTLKNLLK
jgi:hypothetical protein